MTEKPFQIEYDGRTWSGSWSVRDGMVWVSSAYGSKPTQLGGSAPETLAPIMLRELVQAWLAKR